MGQAKIVFNVLLKIDAVATYSPSRHVDSSMCICLCLQSLLKANRNADQVLPVYCFDPRHFKGTYHFDLPKTGSHRAKFLLESVADLRNTLREKGR